MNMQKLPDNIEEQLTALELRHKLHQMMLEEHREKKARRRQEHRERHFIHSVPPICLV